MTCEQRFQLACESKQEEVIHGRNTINDVEDLVADDDVKDVVADDDVEDVVADDDVKDVVADDDVKDLTADDVEDVVADDDVKDLTADNVEDVAADDDVEDHRGKRVEKASQWWKVQWPGHQYPSQLEFDPAGTLDANHPLSPFFPRYATRGGLRNARSQRVFPGEHALEETRDRLRALPLDPPLPCTRLPRHGEDGAHDEESPLHLTPRHPRSEGAAASAHQLPRRTRQHHQRHLGGVCGCYQVRQVGTPPGVLPLPECDALPTVPRPAGGQPANEEYDALPPHPHPRCPRQRQDEHGTRLRAYLLPDGGRAFILHEARQQVVGRVHRPARRHLRRSEPGAVPLFRAGAEDLGRPLPLHGGGEGQMHEDLPRVVRHHVELLAGGAD